jgi:membrane fusion protein, heavy metal efflux system
LLLAGVAAFALFTAVMSCDRQAPGPEGSETPERIEVLDDGRVRVPASSEAFLDVETVGPPGGQLVLTAPARAEFRDGAVVRVAPVAEGRVVGVHVELGDEVRAGQPLVTLDSPQAVGVRTELERARAALRAAEAEHARQRQMYEDEIGTLRELQEAETQLAEARAEVARTEGSTAFLGRGEGRQITVTAPRSGTVLSRSASPGALVDPGDEPLVVLGDPDAVRIVAEIFERDLDLVSVDALVQIEYGAGRALSGRVARIGTVVDARRRAPVYVELEEASTELRPGAFARARIHAQTVEGHLLPPAAVLIQEQRRRVVFVRVDEGIYEAREVTVGQIVEGRVQVLAGIGEGDQVVVGGSLLLDRAASQLL